MHKTAHWLHLPTFQYHYPFPPAVFLARHRLFWCAAFCLIRPCLSFLLLGEKVLLTECCGVLRYLLICLSLSTESVLDIEITWDTLEKCTCDTFFFPTFPRGITLSPTGTNPRNKVGVLLFLLSSFSWCCMHIFGLFTCCCCCCSLYLPPLFRSTSAKQNKKKLCCGIH